MWPGKCLKSSLPCLSLGVMPIVREHMETAQLDQKQAYKLPAQPREFQPGDQVLLLIPNAACKFLAQWQGPFTIFKRVALVNYRLQQLGKHASI